MAYIYIKGRKAEKVTPTYAAEIKKIHEDQNISFSTVIAFKNFSIRKEDIKSVVLVDEEDVHKDKIDQGAEQVKKINSDHQKNIDRLLRLSPEQRAQDTEYFAMYFQALTEQQPKPEERNMAVQAQVAFFKENREAIADPAIFVPIVKASGKGKDLTGFSVVLFNIVKNVYFASRARVPSWEYAQQKSLEL